MRSSGSLALDGGPPGHLLSVVIPALNEAAGIADIAARVQAQAEALGDVGVSGLEVLVVDDGSTDATAEIAAAVPGVRVIQHVENRGYGAAIKTGFNGARGDLLAFLDADGTYPPESLPDLCRTILQGGADVAVGSRMGTSESGMPAVRRLGNTLFAGLVNLVGPGGVTDCASGQRVVRRSALERLYPLPDGLNFTPVMTTRAVHEDLKLVEVPIRYSERVGRSKLSVLHDGRRFLVTILWTTLGYNPGRVLGLAGAGMVAAAAILGAGLVALRVSGSTSLGPWGVLAAVSTLVAAVAGVSVFNLGITANYLVRHVTSRVAGRRGVGAGPAVEGLLARSGVAAIVMGAGVAAGSTWLGLHGWDIRRLWLWLLGSALLILSGLQLAISWVLVRVFEDLSQREARVAADLAPPVAAPAPSFGVEVHP